MNKMCIRDRDKGEQSANIDKLIVQLKSFLKDPDIIPEQVANPNSSFSLSNNISNLSAWLVSASEVPLSIDYLILAPAGSSLPPADAGFFTKLFSSVKNFVFSFFNDYYLIESVAGQTEVHDQISPVSYTHLNGNEILSNGDGYRVGYVTYKIEADSGEEISDLTLELIGRIAAYPAEGRTVEEWKQTNWLKIYVFTLSLIHI